MGHSLSLLFDWMRAAGVLARGRVLNQVNVSDSETSKALQAVRTSGFAVIPQFLPGEAARKLQDDVDRLLDDYSGHVIYASNGADQRLFGAELVSSPIRGYWEDARLRTACRAYSGYQLIGGCTLANRIEASPDNLGSGNGWHRDTAGLRQFKAILYLCDVGEDNGPFQYVVRSHRPWHRVRTALRLRKPFGARRFDDGSDQQFFQRHSQVATVTGKRGTLLLADTSGLHRGKPLTCGVRYALTNYYFDTKAPPGVADLMLRVEPETPAEYLPK